MLEAATERYYLKKIRPLNFKDAEKVLFEKLYPKESRTHTVLHAAAKAGHPKIISEMLAKMSPGNRAAEASTVTNRQPKTPIELAFFKGNFSSAKELAPYSPKRVLNSLLLDSVFKGDFEMAKILLENGANVNIRHPADGSTPLMLAAIPGYKDIAEYLLKKGADPNLLDKSRNSAIMLCAKTGRKGVFQLLLPHSKISAECKNLDDESIFDILKKHKRNWLKLKKMA